MSLTFYGGWVIDELDHTTYHHMYHFRVQSPCTATQQRMLTCLNRGLLWKGGWLEQRTTYRQVEVTVDGAFNAFHYGVIVASRNGSRMLQTVEVCNSLIRREEK